LPVTVDLPPIIIKREDMTLEKLELGEVTVIDNLPKECQKLYWNIAGNNVSLNTPDFPDFADAIEHSIRDNNGICYKKLEEKAKVEGKDLKETYLRVTLGQDQGNSPGVPFVLEIWPSGHYSPIHKHADCFAVIKVLYNEVVALYFAGLEPEEQKWYKRADLKQGEITWISNEFYQTHQLWNPTSKMCATIQCYQYGDNNEEHYENFDYIDSQGIKIKQFKPKSDWTFAKFKNLIKEEW
ncbi:RmlC-like cupin domain-containing protein, partial [Rhizophagus diaphanus]